MKLIEITVIVFAIAGILLAGADSDNFSMFLWSKVIAAGLLGVSIILNNRLEV